MEIFLGISLAVVWLFTVAFAYEGLGRKSGGGPSIGPGLGSAIAIIIAMVGALVSLALMGVLLLRFDMHWHLAACAGFAPVPWLLGAMSRRHRRRV